MLGIDLTQIKRFDNMKERTVKRFLHPDEYAKYLDNKNKPLYLAMRWSIKEALFKADNQYYSYSNVNIKKDSVGRFIFKNFEISTSTDAGLCIAIVKG